MAHHVEPMDIDSSVCDFDDKENAFLHNNVPKTPCTEKGYEELDVSELNMKLRYSLTPAASPMSKSFTANCFDNRVTQLDSENGNMTKSLHTTLTRNDSFNKSQKTLPLKILPTDQGQIADGNRNVLQPLDSTITVDKNITITVSRPNDIDENISLPSSSSSMTHTPEATTPTKEIPKSDASPIMRGLKSVLNMFRPSQSPIPGEDEAAKTEFLSPPIVNSPDTSSQALSMSTPLVGHTTKDPLTKKISLNKESVVFNEDLETDLEWSDDSIIFTNEKIPIHKLFFQQTKSLDAKRTINMTNPAAIDETEKKNTEDKANDTIEYMDISYNDSGIMDKTAPKPANKINNSEIGNIESDSEFVDCESTFTRNESFKSQENTLDSTEDVLSHINDIVEERSLNSTTETLNDIKSTNISATSTVTTKSESASNASDPINLNKVTIEEIKKADPDKPLHAVDLVVSDKKEFDQNTSNSVEKNIINSNAIIEHNANSDVNSPKLENIGVKSISQIPLIVDPRVLLFNIPVASSESKNNVNTSPADIPLPEDDDIPSLPIMNSELETLSRTLDKIAEEIPKINQHEIIGESLVQSDNSTPNDFDRNFSVESDIIQEPVMSEIKVIDSVEIGEIKPPVVSEKQDAVKLTATITDTISMPELLPAESKTDDKNLGVLTTFPDHVNNPTSVSPEITSEVLSAVTENVNNISTEIQITNKPDANFEVNNDLFELSTEAMDVSMIDIQETTENDKFQSKTGEETKTNASIFELGLTSESTTPDLNDVTKGVAVEENQINENEIQKSISIMDVPEFIPNEISKKAQIDENTVEFIKGEIESIINLAIDIAVEKSENNTQVENKANEAELLNANVKILNEENFTKVPESEMELAHQNLASKETPSIEETKALQISYNQLSDSKYNNEVQDIVTANEDIIIEQLGLTTVVPITEEPKVTDTPDEINTTVQIETQKSGNENNTITKPEIAVEDDITEKIEPIATADDEIIASENNSPFVLVQNEIKDVELSREPIENFNDLEKTSAKVVITPPPSPKIVSKGYNFNFDEIDDPFATKTKIRVSPAPDVSPNQTITHNNQTNNQDQSIIHTIEQDPPKRDVNKNARRKSQPEKRRPPVHNKKLNSTFSGKMSDTKKCTASVVKDLSPNQSDNIETKQELKPSLSTDLIVETDVTKAILKGESLNKTQEILAGNEQQKSLVEQSSSSEQSTYFSAATSSEEVIETKIETETPFDDPKFNPFATKSLIRKSPSQDNVISPFTTRSRICVTPPPNMDDTNTSPFATKNKIRNSTETLAISKDAENLYSFVAVPANYKITDKLDYFVSNTTMDIEVSQNDLSLEKEVEPSDGDEKDTSGTTSSSINDKDCTVREVNTEDEDTAEGPFLEADLEDDKFMDFGDKNNDMMRFSNGPQFNDCNQEAGELFIDAEAFEFLLNQNQANTVSDSGKESLFLKFDPLFAKRLSSDGVLAGLKHAQTQAKRSTPIKENTPIPRDATFDISSIAGPSGVNGTQEIDFNNTVEESNDELNVTVSKPMMVVNPAVNPVVTPRNKTTTPARSNRQSLTFSSPAIAVIDRLLSMSTSNNSIMAHDTTVAELHRDNEADLALTQLRELLADKEINVYSLRSETKELQGRLANLESQMKSLEAISEERLRKINELNEKLNKKTKINKNMARVVEEYERTIASLIAETEQDKKRHAEERLQLIMERDEQTAHLASMEVSFNDLHSKYEKSKQVLLGFKANEDACMKSIKEFEENLAKMHKNYELLKQHATSKLNHANEELQKMNKAHEAEVLKMNALIKRKDLHITSLEETLQQKTKANEELTAICDELINKVG